MRFRVYFCVKVWFSLLLRQYCVVKKRFTYLVAAVFALASVSGISPASAATAQARSSVSVSFSGFMGGQGSESSIMTVVVSGVSRVSRVFVEFGGWAVPVVSNCSPSKALRSPFACQGDASFTFEAPGQWQVMVYDKGRVVASRVVGVSSPASPWSPPSNWVQPSNWSLLNSSAHYLPCSVISWSYSSEGEPGYANTTASDIQAAFALISSHAGLRFVEDPSDADISINWAVVPSVATTYPDPGATQVILNPQARVLASSDSRVWVLVHELMHGLGFGHVELRDHIMHPFGTARAFGEGDILGLSTLYPTGSCSF